MITVKKLHDDLDYWAMNNMASDIYEYRSMRPEYLPLVQKAESFGFTDELIVKFVLLRLKDEMAKPWYSKDVFFRLYLIKINIRYILLNFKKSIIRLKIRLKD